MVVVVVLAVVVGVVVVVAVGGIVVVWCVRVKYVAVTEKNDVVEIMHRH